MSKLQPIPSLDFARAYQPRLGVDRSDLKVEDLLLSYYGTSSPEQIRDAITLAKKERKPKRKYVTTAQMDSKYSENAKVKFLQQLDKEMEGWTRASCFGPYFVCTVGRCPDNYQAKKYKGVWYVPNEVADRIRSEREAQVA